MSPAKHRTNGLLNIWIKCGLRNETLIKCSTIWPIGEFEEFDMVVVERDWSEVFWGTMLPVCWVLSPVLAWVAQRQSQLAASMEDKGFQTALYLSIFLALFGLLAMRMLIGRAMDREQLPRAILLGTVSIACSAALISYGLMV
jgi:hypothetical protein